MSRFRLSLVLLAALGLSGQLLAANAWTQLKTGMTLEQVTATLGSPLIRSQGRGIDLWIYDKGGETIATGGVLVGWTTPVDSGKSAATTVTPPPAKAKAPIASEAKAELPAKATLPEKPALRLPLA